MSYYYFAASLPSLQLDGELPFTFSNFKALCQAHLTPAHSAQLNALDASESDSAAHPFVRAWRETDAQIRNAVARHRAARKNLDPTHFVRNEVPHDGRTEKAVADAFALKNPLQREQALDRFRWQQLDERSGFDMFSLESILAYGLKLRIVERWATLNEEDGRVRAEDLIEQRSKDSA